jgi:alpha-tubulin suppressor-like RCC1 family protein
VFLSSLFAAGCVERAEVLTPGSEEPPSSSLVSDVALGEAHGCAIASTRLYCWGNNESGELGLGDTTPREAPTLVDGSWLGVTAGAHHTCALDDLGRVACWGANERGQLGTNDRDARSVPALVSLPQRATFVTSDFSHTCALLSDATLHCWGKNDEGELGQGDDFPGNQSTDADALSPVVVSGTFRSVDTGQGHTCGIRLDGALFCWGRNSEHELGESDVIQVRSPLQVGTDDDWLGVEAGQNHTCGLRQDLFGYCWGLNNGSDAGEGAPLGVAGADLLTVPTRLDAVGDLALLRSDTFHSAAVDRDGRLYSWGRNTEGQLGLGDNTLRDSPELVGTGYTGVAVGRFATCAVAAAGSLACAGKNDVGQLGTGDRAQRSTLTPVALPLP